MFDLGRRNRTRRCSGSCWTAFGYDGVWGSVDQQKAMCKIRFSANLFYS